MDNTLITYTLTMCAEGISGRPGYGCVDIINHTPITIVKFLEYLMKATVNGTKITNITYKIVGDDTNTEYKTTISRCLP